MITIGMLWLSILVATVVVFFACFVMWMVSPHHKQDWSKMPGEEEVMAALRAHGVGAGQWVMPHCASPKDMGNPEYMKRYEEGPSGFLIIRPSGKLKMGKNLVLSFAHNLVVSVLMAYLCSFLLTTESSGMEIFRLVGTAGFLAYSGALPAYAIWFERTWGSITREMIDGLVNGLLMGGTFALLWP